MGGKIRKPSHRLIPIKYEEIISKLFLLDLKSKVPTSKSNQGS